MNADTDTATENLVQKTPWWAISISLHALGALLIAFFWVVVPVTADEPPVGILKPPPIDPPEFKHKPPPHKKLWDRPEKAREVAYKKAEEADESQTPDDEIFKKNKGDSEDMLVDKPFKSKAATDTIGTFWSYGVMHNYAVAAALRRRSFRGGFYDIETREADAVPDWIAYLNLGFSLAAVGLLILSAVIAAR